MKETMSTRTNYYDNLPPVDAKAATPDLPPVPEIPEPIKIPPMPNAVDTKSSSTSTKTAEPKPSDPKTNDNDNWKDFDFNKANNKESMIRPLPLRETIRFVAAGLMGGVLVWLFRLALENWAMKPLFCRTPDTASVCANADMTSFIIALVVVGIIMSVLLSYARAFRATLITLATFVSLGALWPILDNREWLVATLWLALFATALYVFYALIAATKKYILAVVLLALLTSGFWLLVRM